MLLNIARMEKFGRLKKMNEGEFLQIFNIYILDLYKHEEDREYG